MRYVNTDFPKRPAWMVALITVSVFLLIDNLNSPLYKTLAVELEGNARLGVFIAVIYGSSIFGSMIVAALLFGRQRIFQALGLDGNVLSAFAFALLVTGLMLVFLVATTPFALPEQPLLTLLRGAVLPGIGEEIFYRAFLFGFLFRFARWGFLPASILVAVLFGAAHLYQGSSPAESAGIFAITAIGAIWFSWLYAEWGFNIWVPAFSTC